MPGGGRVATCDGRWCLVALLKYFGTAEGGAGSTVHSDIRQRRLRSSVGRDSLAKVTENRAHRGRAGGRCAQQRLMQACHLLAEGQLRVIHIIHFSSEPRAPGVVRRTIAPHSWRPNGPGPQPRHAAASASTSTRPRPCPCPSASPCACTLMTPAQVDDDDDNNKLKVGS